MPPVRRAVRYWLYKDLWGNSAKEVFVTRYYWNDEECGAFQARWFDGAVVGRL